MTARHRISFVVLTVLVSLPATATICAMLCAPAATATAASHHGSGVGCEQAPSAATTLMSASAENCETHPATARQAPTTAAARADGLATSAPPNVAKTAEMNVPLEIPREHGSIVDPNPPGPKPPKKKTPLLRV